jgi:hypothetical protein
MNEFSPPIFQIAVLPMTLHRTRRQSRRTIAIGVLVTVVTGLAEECCVRMRGTCRVPPAS